MLHLALAMMLWGQTAAGLAGRAITLSLPHPPAHGETVWLKVDVGAIGHGQVRVTTERGRELGTISTYGLKAGRVAGTYTLPVPADALSGDRIRVVFTMIEGNKERPATQAEVTGVSVGIRPAGR